MHRMVAETPGRCGILFCLGWDCVDRCNQMEVCPFYLLEPGLLVRCDVNCRFYEVKSNRRQKLRAATYPFLDKNELYIYM